MRIELNYCYVLDGFENDTGECVIINGVGCCGLQWLPRVSLFDLLHSLGEVLFLRWHLCIGWVDSGISRTFDRVVRGGSMRQCF